MTVSFVSCVSHIAEFCASSREWRRRTVTWSVSALTKCEGVTESGERLGETREELGGRFQHAVSSLAAAGSRISATGREQARIREDDDIPSGSDCGTAIAHFHKITRRAQNTPCSSESRKSGRCVSWLLLPRDLIEGLPTTSIPSPRGEPSAPRVSWVLNSVTNSHRSVVSETRGLDYLPPCGHRDDQGQDRPFPTGVV